MVQTKSIKKILSFTQLNFQNFHHNAPLIDDRHEVMQSKFHPFIVIHLSEILQT